MNTELQLHDRELTLFRYPKRSNETLQAWDAGDEYLINYVEELNLTPNQHIVILNDNFGALACWFTQKHRVTSISDSFISQQGAQANLELNHCNDVTFLTSLDDIPRDADLVLMQIPKSNRYLTWQLNQVRTSVSKECQFIAVNKVKEIHTSTLKLFERFLGETKTSLAKKKHRLVFSTINPGLNEQVEAFTSWDVEGHDITLDNMANVYSGESLDLGARFILQHIPQDSSLRHIIDLGCGNGVLSVKAAQLNPQAKITSVDESYMAVASAKRNIERNVAHKGNENAEYQAIANNCLDGLSELELDLILCNPPFHQKLAVTDHIAWQMFCDAKQTLVSGGKLMVIGNRHLGYDNKLKRLFGDENVKLVSSNNKFVILQATKNPAKLGTKR